MSLTYMTVRDYSFLANEHSYFTGTVNKIFQPDDYVKETRLLSSHSEMIWGNAYEKEKGSYLFRGFRQSVKICRSRLEIYGMNEKSAAAIFDRCKQEEQAYVQPGFDLKAVSFEQYKEEIRYIIDNRLKDAATMSESLRDMLITFNLSIGNTPGGFDLYAILSVLHDDDIVEYNLSDITYEGYQPEPIVVEKIIVLTEGKTDTEFISKSMSRLCPHLVPYYHFIDFGEFKMEGSASALVRIAVSFAAANIRHPIIVLFDNDATGIMELRRLQREKLPDNIRAIRLPNIDLAKDYPTIGPSGEQQLNINGFAGSIEMYFGRDVLTIDGSLSRVQWKGYNESENKYQGELMNKRLLQDRYRTKLANLSASDFTDMRLVLQHIFGAFA